MGRIMHTERIMGAQGQLIWDTRSVAAGSYVVEVLGVGAPLVHSEKLIVRP